MTLDPQFLKGWRCPTCAGIREEDGAPDPCLGYLPGVSYACCGHGGQGNCPGYISFENGVVIRMTIHSVEYSNPHLAPPLLAKEKGFFRALDMAPPIPDPKKSAGTP